MAAHSGGESPGHVSLDVFPDDIIEQILLHVSPLDNLATLQPVSRRLRRLATRPLLWKRHCLATFRYWQPEHCLPHLLTGKASATNWKALFLTRQKQRAVMANILERIVATRVDRIPGMHKICKYGYDAKDFLIEKSRTVYDDPDVLAIRYHATATLGSIHRGMAMQEWLQVCNSGPSFPYSVKPSLEKSIAAFDLFVLHDQRGDIVETSKSLDGYAREFLSLQSQWKDKSTRQKALALNEWLRANNLAGLQNEHMDYRNLRNCFIGQALRDPKHESIPIISCTIYCSIAERVGLQAGCFLAPICVHVVVTAPAGFDLDMNTSTAQHQMFLDPFGTDGEVSLDHLQQLVSHADLTIDSLRRSGTVAAVTIRAARNIEASCAAAARRTDPLAVSRLIHGHPDMNRKLALYATRWALLVLQHPPFSRAWAEQRKQLVREIQRDWPEDEWIMAKYVLAQGQRTGTDEAMREMEMYVMPNLDPPRRRPEQVRLEAFQRALTPERVAPFHLGQVFRHRRYEWLGAIVGFYEMPPASWGMFDAAAEGGSAAQQSDDERKRFYVKTIAASSTDERVIAPGNIEIVNDESLVTGRMFPLAGKYFKRFHRDSCCFISNVDEEYPRLTAEA